MTQKHILTSLTLLIFLALAGGQVLQSQAAALPEAETPPKIDQAVWEAIAASPTREVTVVVSLRPEGGGGPELAIDAQFRLEQLLDLLAERGGLSGYQAFYGANIIKVTGGLGLLRLLEDWPEMESVALYQPGEDWELGAESTLRSETLSASGLMIGKVTASNGGAALEGIRVTAYRLTGGVSWEVAGTAFTNASGDYAVSGLASGIYRARFDDPAGNYANQFFDNKATFLMATNFNVTDGQETPDINAAMVLAGKISGALTIVAGGGPAEDVIASAWAFIDSSWQVLSQGLSASNGAYTIGGLPPGTYRVRFADIYSPPNYIVQWYDGQLVVDNGQKIFVTAGTTVTGINAAMGSYGSITGNIKADDGVTNLAGIIVGVYRNVDTDWEVFDYESTDASGNFEVNGLSTGDYRLEFIDTLGQFTTEFYYNKPYVSSADNVAVVLGYATPNINAQLSLKTNTVTNSLVEGWNLVSLPVIMDNSTTPIAFESVSGSYNEIFAYDACDTSVPFNPWKFFTPDLLPDHPANDLTDVNVRMGYWIRLNNEATLSLSGVHPLTTSITLCEGWNLIGYPSLATPPVADALTSIAGKYTLVRQYRAEDPTPWKTFNPGVPPALNTLKIMEPGYGYWIYMTEAATLVVAGR